MAGSDPSSANFGEPPRREVPGTLLPRTRVNKGPGLLRVAWSFMENSWPHPKYGPPAESATLWHRHRGSRRPRRVFEVLGGWIDGRPSAVERARAGRSGRDRGGGDGACGGGPGGGGTDGLRGEGRIRSREGGPLRHDADAGARGCPR